MAQVLLEGLAEREKRLPAKPQTSIAFNEIPRRIDAGDAMKAPTRVATFLRIPSEAPTLSLRPEVVAKAQRRRWMGTLACVTTLVAYPVLFVPLFGVFGPAVGALYFLPALAVAWRFGSVGGVMVALAGIPVNQLLYSAVGFTAGLTDMGVLLATAANVAVAAFVGHVRTLQLALRSSEERFRLIASTSTDVIWDYNPSTDTAWVSSSFGGIGEKGGATVPKSAWLQRVHPDDLDRVQAEVAARMAAGVDEWTQEYRIARDDGTYADVVDRAHVIRTPNGNVDRIVGTLTDTTAQREADRERERAIVAEQAVRNLREVDAFKTQLLNTASHELNTPISALRLQLYLLELEAKKDPSSPLNAATKILNRNVERLSTLVRDTLDVARLRSGKLELRVASFGLDDLIQEAVATFRPLAAQLGQELHVDAQPGIMLNADQTRLSQVVYNLMSNAIKFNPPGGTVNLQATLVDDRIRVTVQDSGVGLTQEQIGRLFQPFSRVHDEKAIPAKGTGLGLYISHAIVARHGGRLWCESPGPGQGTMFIMEVPIEPQQPSPAATMET